jgi:hypothetical protein
MGDRHLYWPLLSERDEINRRLPQLKLRTLAISDRTSCASTPSTRAASLHLQPQRHASIYTIAAFHRVLALAAPRALHDGLRAPHSRPISPTNRVFTSRIGGIPKNLRYSLLNWLALSYPTSNAALAASIPSFSIRSLATCSRSCF